LEIKLRVQRGMTHIILTFTIILPAKTLSFLERKNRIQTLVKNTLFLSGFSIVVYKNQAVQLK